MSSYKVEQRRLRYLGQDFHFVSYEPRPANERRGEEAQPAMWYLMREGRRHAVMPQVQGQSQDELDQALIAWLDQHVFSAGRRASG